jgi:hypothetical protein
MRRGIDGRREGAQARRRPCPARRPSRRGQAAAATLKRPSFAEMSKRIGKKSQTNPSRRPSTSRASPSATVLPFRHAQRPQVPAPDRPVGVVLVAGLGLAPRHVMAIQARGA